MGEVVAFGRAQRPPYRAEPAYVLVDGEEAGSWCVRIIGDRVLAQLYNARLPSLDEAAQYAFGIASPRKLPVYGPDSGWKPAA